MSTGRKSLCDTLADEVRAEIADLSFSETLDLYLDMREHGPDERSGYTDKAHWYKIAALRERMNKLTKPTQQGKD